MSTPTKETNVQDVIDELCKQREEALNRVVELSVALKQATRKLKELEND